uniref:G patch domain-containing protein 4 n=1 Tax=Leptobrachium leishanense TaxID=445787 RepID=A0A8C5WFS4_9ANUR
MSKATSRKSQGMRFAEEQLQRHGWTEGKGLGKRESGISKAIKVKVKCDKAGVGHDSAEQFTFHWWDHVFNKTAASISVEADQDGVQVKKMEGDCTVTNKKPRKALGRNNMLYGRFIKSATLLSGGEAPGEKPSSSESSDTEDEDEKLDLSSATKMTDEDLIKVCGGRTAHKGARHGLTMSAKLSRLEEQERAFLEKYSKKEDKKKTEPKVVDDSVRPKKHKKKKKNLREVESDPGADILSEPVKMKDTPDEEEAGHNCHEAEESRAEGRKKRKKHRREPESPEEPTDQDKEPMDSEVKVKKKKKSKKEVI